eukprot:7517049-Pyramimonas_sp.AAC.1
MGRNGKEDPRTGSQYAKCRCCGYKWNWATRTDCYKCKRGLQPPTSQERAPQGEWGPGGASERRRSRGAAKVKATREELLKQLRATIPDGDAELARHLEALARVPPHE